LDSEEWKTFDDQKATIGTDVSSKKSSCVILHFINNKRKADDSSGPEPKRRKLEPKATPTIILC